MKRGTKGRQEESRKKKTVLTAGVSYQEGIWLKCCMDRTMGSLRGSI